jgi:hypothetical protein
MQGLSAPASWQQRGRYLATIQAACHHERRGITAFCSPTPVLVMLA